MLSMRFSLLGAILSYFYPTHCTPVGPTERDDAACGRKTKVAVLGAGTAGIMAAKALIDNGITDFLVIENNDRIGGRLYNHPFGKDTGGPNSTEEPFTIELGANWVHGTTGEYGHENPIFSLVKESRLRYYPTDYEDLLAYDSSGPVDPLSIYRLALQLGEVWVGTEADSGRILSTNLPDRSLRAGLRSRGWDPLGDPLKLALEWYAIDFELAQSSDVSSQLFSVVAFNSTEGYYSGENLFVMDKRGYGTWLTNVADEFLKDSGGEFNDRRVLLKHRVTNIDTVDASKVIISTNDTSQGCIEAEYAITTFSIGVLQQRVVDFLPDLPSWKQEAIDTMQIGLYTKIFMQFPPDQVFWPKDEQFFVYASKQRGYYPAFQNLDHENFFPGSGLIFVTVTGNMALQIDQQTDEETKGQIMKVFSEMFPDVSIPEPDFFYYPRWSKLDWAYGSFSNVPPGMTLEMRQNLRANVDRVWFAGEHTSINWFGFLHGAYFEGKEAGERVAARLNGDMEKGKDMKRYENLHGTTDPGQWKEDNGYFIDSLAVNSTMRSSGRGKRDRV